MRLEQIHLENYRSIGQVDLDIDDLQIIFGRNNVGKSNILHALRDYQRYGVGADSFESIYDSRKRDKQPRPISINIEFSLNSDDSSALLNTLENHDSLNGVSIEELEKNGFASRISHGFVVDSKGVRYADLKASYNESMVTISKLKIRTDGNINTVEKSNFKYIPEEKMSQKRAGAIKNTESVLIGGTQKFLRNKLDSWKWTSPFRHPDMKGSIKEVYSLDNESNNLAVVLDTLANNWPETFESIEESFVDIMEGVTGLNTPIRTGRETKTTVEVKEGDTKFDLKDISAGSQQILALLTELETAGTQTDVLLLEEPETHLHPGAQRTIYKIVKRVSERTDTQIILTTHSEVFLDAGDSSQLIKASRKDGNTVFSKVDKDIESEAMTALGYEKSALLQARAVVFVEGLSDKRILSQFAESVGFSLPDNGIEVIDLEGEGNIKSDGQSLVKLVSAFDIPFLFVLDSHDHDPQTEQNALLKAVNSPKGDWEVTPEDIFVWEGYGIETYLLDAEAIATHLGAEVETVEELLEQYEDEKEPASVLNAVFQEIRDQGFVKENDGGLIAAKIDSDDFDPEVQELIDEIQSLTE